MSEPSPSNETRRIEALTSRLCDQSLSPSEADELTRLLAGNAENLATYCTVTSLHLDLSKELRVPQQVSRSGTSCKKASLLGRKFSALYATLGALAAVAVVGLTVWLTAGPSEPAFTARVVRKIDCDFGDNRWSTSGSNEVQAGNEIALEQGLVVLEFGNGAEVMLEGPARFVVSQADRGRLTLGRLTANVGRRGRGFAVDMPGVELVDLGTRFGAVVDSSGVCEAHVFDGEVQLRTGDAGQESNPQTLLGGEALRINPAEHTTRRIESRPRAFVQTDRFADPQRGDAKIVRDFEFSENVVLWYRADAQLQLDATDHVVAWGNLIDRDDTRQANAWQVSSGARPKHVWDEQQERAALRFDGKSHLKIAPLPTQGDLTLVCVFRRRSGAARQCVIDFGTMATLQIDTSQLAPRSKDETVIAVSTFDRDSNRRTLFLNGKRSDSPTQRDGGAFSESSNVIGATSNLRNRFVGDLYEVMALDAHLTPEQCETLCRDRMRDYDIAPESSEPRILANPHATPSE